MYSMSLGLSALSYATTGATTNDNRNTTTTTTTTMTKVAAANMDDIEYQDEHYDDDEPFTHSGYMSPYVTKQTYHTPTSTYILQHTTTTNDDNDNDVLVYNNTKLNRQPISLHNKYEVLRSIDANACTSTRPVNVPASAAVPSTPALPKISELAATNIYVPAWVRGETCCSANTGASSTALSVCDSSQDVATSLISNAASRVDLHVPPLSKGAGIDPRQPRSRTSLMCRAFTCGLKCNSSNI